MIVEVMKEFQAQDQDNVQQSEVINRMIQKLEIENLDSSTSVQKSIETSKKVSNVIQYLIKSENVLMISQESRVKNERYLAMGVDHGFQNMNLGKDWINAKVYEIDKLKIKAININS